MTPCPSDSELDRLVSNALDDASIAFVHNHIQQCDSCRTELNKKQHDQSLFGDLQRVVALQKNHSDLHEAKLTEVLFNHAMELRGYRILGELHRGGQGIVSKAIQLSTNRLVAIKQLIYEGRPNPDQLQRFEREIDVVARLSHPNIVTIFDSGTIEECPFFIMELVNGETLGQFTRSTFSVENGTRVLDRQSLVRILRLFRTICSAVSYAHRLGIIHRDLKPGNILIDENLEPQILDFGLAKPANDVPQSDLTKTGLFLGTLAYASPEQFQLERAPLDIRTDVYSLGVILYEMLTAHLPFRVDGGLSQTINRILESSPVNPSLLCHAIDHDVETIVLKALAKAPDRRYQSVDQFDHDIELYLTNRPIEAKRDSTLYVIRKSLHRHKLLVATTVFSFVIITSALIASLFFWSQAATQRDLAQSAKGNESIAREEAEYRSYGANIAAAKGSIALFDVAEAKRRLALAPAIYRNWEWYHWMSRADSSRRTFHHHDQYVLDFELFPDGNKVASVAADMALRIWTLTGNDSLEVKFSLAPLTCSINGNGSLIACSFSDQTIRLIDVNTLGEITRIQTDLNLHDICFIPDGQRLAACGDKTSQNGTVLLWNYEDGETETIPEQFDFVRSIAMHPTELRLGVAAGRLGIVNLEALDFREVSSQGYFVSVDFDPSGEFVVAAAHHEAAVWNTRTGSEISRFKGHKLPISHVAFSNDGKTIATCSSDQTVRTWDRKSGRQLSLDLGHDQTIVKVKYIDGTTLLSASKDSTFKSWKLRSITNPQQLSHHNEAVRDLDFSPDSQRVASASQDTTVLIRELSGKIVEQLKHSSAVFSARFNPNGTQLATAGDEHVIRIWDLEKRSVKKLKGHTDRVHSVSYDASGQRLVSASRDGTVRIWDTATSELIHEFDKHEECVHKAVFDPSGGQVASRSHGGVKLWRVSDSKELFAFEQRIGPEDYSLSFHPDGKRLAAGSSIEGFGKGFVNLLNLDSKSLIFAFEQHNGPITSFEFSPDGTRAVSSSLNAIKIWDVERGTEVASLDIIDSFVYCVRFSPDGTKIASGMFDGSVRIWDSAPQSNYRNGTELIQTTSQ